MSLLRIALPRDLRPPEARKSVHMTLKELHKRFQTDVPLLDPVKVCHQPHHLVTSRAVATGRSWHHCIRFAWQDVGIGAVVLCSCGCQDKGIGVVVCLHSLCWQDMGIEDPGLMDLIKQVEAEDEKLHRSRLFQVGAVPAHPWLPSQAPHPPWKLSQRCLHTLMLPGVLVYSGYAAGSC